MSHLKGYRLPILMSLTSTLQILFLWAMLDQQVAIGWIDVPHVILLDVVGLVLAFCMALWIHVTLIAFHK